MVQTQLVAPFVIPGEVLLTGATGFVGTHVAEALTGRAGSIRALVRAGSRVDRLRALGVETTTAPLEDAGALAAAVRGASVVIHLAALTHARTAAELEAVNVAGTHAVVAALLAAEPRPRRLVYMSSLAAAGPGERAVGRADPPRPLTAYGRSKLAGERVVQAAGEALEVVILRAPAVYGPGDRELLRFFRMARLGVLPVPTGPSRPLQLVYVRDLADAVVRAAAAPGAGGVYHVAEEAAYTWATVCRLLGRVAGRRVQLLPVPAGLIGAAAAASEFAAGLVGRSTMFNRDKARELLAPGWLCDTADARQELGFVAATPLEQGLRETWQWYRNEGWL
jgi:nucleoside-diphosphate-sugar epimerase